MKTAIRLLKEDHADLRKLFRRFRKGKGHDAGLFRQIQEELNAHARIEDELLYPALLEIATDESEARHHEAQEEHEEIRMLLGKLGGFDPESPRFPSAMETLSRVVDRHIEHEEKAVFPLMRLYVSRTEFQEMGRQIEERRAARA